MDFPLSKEVIRDLRKQQKVCKKNKDTKGHIKISIILFLDLGFTLEKIAKGLGIDIETVFNSKKKYKASKDIKEYLSTNYKQNNLGKLTEEQKKELTEHLDENLYATCKEIAHFIKKKFAIEYTPNGLCLLLKKLGYVYKQTKMVPGKADVKEQKRFVKKLLELKKTLKQGEKLYFVDGVHPVHNTVNVKVWTRKGKERKIKSNTGRTRININGAMNALDTTEIIYREDKTLNKETNLKFMEKILSQNQPATKITLICDNARYYKNKETKNFLAKHKKLKILFLPPYSPNLNLIERLWRLMRKKKINCRYYENFKDFKKEIIDFFENIKNYDKELKSLITWKFHFP